MSNQTILLEDLVRKIQDEHLTLATLKTHLSKAFLVYATHPEYSQSPSSSEWARDVQQSFIRIMYLFEGLEKGIKPPDKKPWYRISKQR